MLRLLCANDIAARVGVHQRTAIRLLECGEIAAFKDGARWRTTEQAYEEWVRQKLQPYRVNALTAPILPMRVLFRDR
jgi:excisionase family DNA binding protein